MENNIELMKRYLAHLEIDESEPKNLEFLNQLIKKHLHRIPWENWELFFERKVTLDPTELITRYVTNNRGGLCYQLNMTLYYLLRYLGFSVELRAATVLGYLKKTYKRQRDTHILNVINYQEKPYLVDVGWGEIQSLLSLEEKGTFQLSSHDTDQYEFIVNYCLESNAVPQYKVRREPLSQMKLNECTDYSEKNEEREVQNGFVCHKRIDETSSILLNDEIIKIMNGKNVTEKSVAEYGGIKLALKNFFDIN